MDFRGSPLAFKFALEKFNYFTEVTLFKNIYVMPTDSIKNKINKRLEKMDNKQLQSAYQILKEFSIQEENQSVKLNKNLLEIKINKGITELDNKEGTDFKNFLKEMKLKYGNGK